MAKHQICYDCGIVNSNELDADEPCLDCYARQG